MARELESDNASRRLVGGGSTKIVNVGIVTHVFYQVGGSWLCS